MNIYKVSVRFLLVLLVGLVLCYSGRADGDNIRRDIDSLANLLTTAHDSVKARYLIQMGQSYENIRTDSAIFYFTRAIKQARKMADSVNVSAALNSMGNIYQKIADYPKSLAYYNQSLEISKFMKDSSYMSSTLNNIGNVYDNLGDYSKALEYMLKSIKIDESLGDKDAMATSYNNLGLLYYRQEDFEMALKYYNITLKLRQELGDKEGVALVYNNIGIIYYYIDEMDKVLEYFKKSLHIYEEIGDIRQQALPLFNIGQLYYQQGKTDLALDYIFRSLKIEKQLNDKRGMADTYDFLGSMYGEMGDYNLALEYQKMGLKIAQEIGANLEARHSFESLSQTYEELGDYKQALEYYKNFKMMNDSVYNLEKSSQIAELNTMYETEKKEQEIELLNKDKQLQDIQIERQRNLIITFIVGLILIVFFAIIVYRQFIQKRKAYRELEEKNSRIMQQKEEIETQRDQIEAQRDQLLTKNEEILQQKEEIESQRDEIEAQRDVATQQRDQIAYQKQEITDSILYAERIQTALMPLVAQLNEYLKQHFILYQPKDIVSGDFHWFQRVGSRKVVMAVADCTGHGVPGAFISMLGMAFLNEIIRSYKTEEIEAANILNDLKQKVIKSLHQKETNAETKD
ncbi:MAG: hypothetical protein C0594_08645 [Marinilabiliales bacterium]|nr:MAG: hypothetical protein C0594_08645 [Marinilabiliales bacterium]